MLDASLQLGPGARVTAAPGSFVGREKVCIACGTMFRRPGNVGRAAWTRRQFCSTACSNRHRDRCRAAPEETKLCLGCGQPFQRGAMQAMNWVQKLYCRKNCSSGSRVPRPSNVIVATPPRVLREWPPEARFDAPGMNLPDGPGRFVRIQIPDVSRTYTGCSAAMCAGRGE